MRNSLFLFALPFVALISSGCSNTSNFNPTESSLRIDKGTVYITISDQPMSAPHRLEVRPQGDCTPEMNIEKYKNFTRVRHKTPCKTVESKQGTQFDVILASNRRHTVSLTAGDLRAPAIETSTTIRRIDASVFAGGIEGGGKLTTSKRKHLTGAKATAINPELDKGTELVLNVDAGAITFTSQP